MVPRVFRTAFEVRDYECDLQGIVNNAVYLHYLEHARHQALKQGGLDFAALAAQGLHLVVVRSEVDYKAPLRSGDQFVVESRLERLSPVRVVFAQEMYRDAPPPRLMMLQARVVCAAMDARGRPVRPAALETLFEPQPRVTRKDA